MTWTTILFVIVDINFDALTATENLLEGENK